MEVPEQASRAHIFQAIRTAVAQGFDIQEPSVGASFPVLKYRDEEGDLCTLVEASVDDMLEFSKCGTLRLFMSKTHTAIVEAIVVDKISNGVPQLASGAEIEAGIAVAASEGTDAVAADAAAVTEEATVEDDHGQSAAEELVSGNADKEQAFLEERVAAEDAVAEDTAVEGAADTVEADFINEKSHSETEETLLEKLDANLRGLPSNVMEQLQMLRDQLQEMRSNAEQQRAQFQDRMENGEFERLQRLQATLEQMKARLDELKELAKAGVKKTIGSQLDAMEEEALLKAEAQLSDARLLVAETLASLHARGSHVVMRATAKYSRTSEDEDADAVAPETTDASMGDSAPAEHTPARKPDVKNATRMDHVQVLVSKSMGGFRSLATRLFRSDPLDPWLTAASAAAAEYDAAAAATDDAASAASADDVVVEEMSVSQAES